MISHVLRREVYDCILPRETVSTADWCERFLVMPPDSKIQGAYRLDLFPHFREPMDAFDDPDVTRITVQTASQIGKTVFAQACLVKTVATNPHPMAFADADERSCRRVMKRTWKFLNQATPTANLCPPQRLQATDRIELPTCVVHGAWAGSSSSAADYGAFVVVLNEADKMRHRSTDLEADFRFLMCERTKGYVGAKIIEISTPSLQGESYIETQRLAGDNRRRMVPCPHCKKFQELFTGDGQQPGGLRFDKRSDGSLDAKLARNTAYYECKHCRKKIVEQHRFAMCNAGVWVPEGCKVGRSGKITGKPTNPGSHASFGPLSTLHSLLPGVTLGVIAENYVKAITARENRREAIRNYVNSWDGKTFNPQPKPTTTVDIIHRIAIEHPLRVVPKWGKFVTFAADVGRDDARQELTFVWGAAAWGDGSRGQLIDFGQCFSRQEFRELVASLSWPHEDGGPPAIIAVGGVDCGDGNSSNAVYDLCDTLPTFWPVKGGSRNDPDGFETSASNRLEMYHGGFKAEENARAMQAKRRLHDFDILIVNTERTQNWIEDRLGGLVKPDEPEWFSIPVDAMRGQIVPGIDLAKHLQGDYRDSKGRWKKRWRKQEMRDVIRYLRVLAEKHTDNGTEWNNLPPRIIHAASHDDHHDDYLGEPGFSL